MTLRADVVVLYATVSSSARGRFDRNGVLLRPGVGTELTFSPWGPDPVLDRPPLPSAHTSHFGVIANEATATARAPSSRPAVALRLGERGVVCIVAERRGCEPRFGQDAGAVSSDGSEIAFLDCKIQLEYMG